jgi:hypothetical protein
MFHNHASAVVGVAVKRFAGLVLISMAILKVHVQV